MTGLRKFILTAVGIVATVTMFVLSPKDLGCLTAAGGTLVAVLAFFFNANTKENGKGNNGNGTTYGSKGNGRIHYFVNRWWFVVPTIVVLGGAVLKCAATEAHQDDTLKLHSKEIVEIKDSVKELEGCLKTVNYKLDRAFLIDSLRYPNIAQRAISILDSNGHSLPDTGR